MSAIFPLRRTRSLLLQRGRARGHQEYRQGTLSEGFLQNHTRSPLRRSERACLIMHADGAGTKSSLAYAYWRETGDLSVWKGIAQDAVVMNTDDLLCVGATGQHTAFVDHRPQQAAGARRSDLGRHQRHRRVPPDDARPGRRDLLDRRRDGRRGRSGAHDHRGQYRHGPYAPQRCDRQRRISERDAAIVGLASFGQATYETEYNGGMGSNGLTSARHDVFAQIRGGEISGNLRSRTFPSDLVYTGRYGTDRHDRGMSR